MARTPSTSRAGTPRRRSRRTQATERSPWQYGEEDRGPHYGKGPKGYKRSDERIREDINDRLTDDLYLDASDIEVTVSNAEATLSGTVESQYEQWREILADIYANETGTFTTNGAATDQ